jgi:hypothetical protein
MTELKQAHKARIAVEEAGRREGPCRDEDGERRRPQDPGSSPRTGMPRPALPRRWTLH